MRARRQGLIRRMYHPVARAVCVAAICALSLTAICGTLDAQRRVREHPEVRLTGGSATVEASEEGILFALAYGNDSNGISVNASRLSLWLDTATALMNATLPTPPEGERVEYETPGMDGEFGGDLTLKRIATAKGLSYQLYFYRALQDSGSFTLSARDAAKVLAALRNAAKAAHALRRPVFLGPACTPAGPFDRVAIHSAPALPDNVRRGVERILSAYVDPPADTDTSSLSAEVGATLRYRAGDERYWLERHDIDGFLRPSGDSSFDHMTVANAFNGFLNATLSGFTIPTAADGMTWQLRVQFGCAP